MSLIFKKSTAQPAFTVAAAITGTVQVGQTLTCTYTVTKARANNVTVRWYSYFDAEGTDQVLVGTGTTYVLTGNELGRYIRTIVTASNPAGTVQSTSSYTAAVTTEVPPDPPTVTSAAAITGTLEVGQTLTVSVTFSGATSTTYQWYSYTSAGGAGASALGTSTTQALAVAEDGKYIGCQATGTNASGSTVSTATLVGPVAANASEAPTVVSAATIALDDGADGYNEGEYIICDAEFSGHTSTPTFTWYKCDVGKANPEELVGAGETVIRPLPVSAPNAYRGALFLASSLGLHEAGKYVYCVVSATNGAGTTPSESDAVGPVGAIVGTGITQAMVGSGPYYLPSASTTYYLAEDISTDGTAFVLNKASQKLNLNGKTVTFDNAAAVTPSNCDFESGATGWNFSATGNPGGGASTVGTATYADIYTTANFTQDYCRRRLNDGTKSLTFTNAALTDNGVERYVTHTSTITLVAGKSYSVSGMFWKNNNSGTVFARLRHATDGIVATASSSENFTRGMRYLESTPFRCQSSPAEYTLEVGLIGATGATGSAYIDSVQVTRTRSCGALVTAHTAENATRVLSVSIVNGGSGYVDGTYSSVQTSRVSGSSFTKYPLLNITVSGGEVVSATIVASIKDRGEFVFVGTTLTASAASLGGSGSGFVCEVDSVYHYYPGDQGDQLRPFPLDQTTRTNAASSCVVKNGTFVQGADRCTWAAAVRYDASGTRIHRVDSTIYGHNSSHVRNRNPSGQAITVKDCYVDCQWTVSGQRDYQHGAALHYTSGTIARNTLLNCPINGLYTSSSVTAYGNVVKCKNRWSNGRALGTREVSGTVNFYDNVIDNTGDYSGRAVAIDNPTGTVNVYNNHISFQPAILNSEYGGYSEFGDHGIQVEGALVGATINISGNTINAVANEGQHVTNSEYCVANAIQVTNVKNGTSLNIYANDISATASNGGYATCFDTGGGETWYDVEMTAAIYNNTMSSNSMYCKSARDAYTQFKTSTVNWTEPTTSEARPLGVTYDTVANSVFVDFLDCTYGTGALAKIAASSVYVEPRFGTLAPASRGGYYVRWTITVDAGEAGATVVLKDNGGNTLATSTTEVNGTCIFEAPQYYMSGSTQTDYNSGAGLSVEATKDALSGSASFVADSAKTVTVSMA